MAEIQIQTYEDMVTHLMDVFGFERSTVQHRQALRAIQSVYRTFPDKHRWSYFERRGQIHTLASQTTGTIAFDLTGGSFERMVTLSDATWPDVEDVRVYKIIIDQVQYDIEDKKSSTVITLSANTHPAADVAAGASYTLYKSRYNLPVNFRKMVTPLMNLSRAECLTHVEPGPFLEHMNGNYQPSDPDVYTIHNAGEYYGGWVVDLAPPPNQAETWDFIYEAMPRPLRIERYATGTATTNGTTTVTGSGTAFTSKMPGSILRLPVSGATLPGGLAGGEGLEPYDVQRVIASVESTTSLTVDSSISTRAGVGLVISDPVDMEPGSMLQAFIALCEAEWAKYNNRKDWKEYAMNARDELLMAMSADNRQRDIGSMPVQSDRLGGMAYSEAFNSLGTV